MTKTKIAAGERNGHAGPAAKEQTVTITPPKMEVVPVLIRGTAPLVMNAFSRRQRGVMKATQEAGAAAKKGKKREPKDFNQCYEDAKHVSTDGWCGIPATAFRSAMIDACRLVGFKMTHGKLGVFVEADGFDADDGTPLVRISKGEPHYVEHAVRNATGVADIRARPMWDPGWEAVVRIRYDADMFGLVDVMNLLARAGCQIGLCEGRPNSKNGHGMGWGLFEICSTDDQAGE